MMWYTLPDSNKQYALSIETVRKIRGMNMKGVKAETLETEEIVSNKPKEIEPEFVDVVGQISLRSLEKNDKKRRFNKGRDQQKPEQKDNRDTNLRVLPGSPILSPNRRAHRSNSEVEMIRATG